MGSVNEWWQREKEATERSVRPTQIELSVRKWPRWPQVAQPAKKRLGWTTVLAAVVLCIVWGIAIATASPDGRPDCGGKKMTRDMVCDSVKLGVVVDTHSYDDMASNFQRYSVAWVCTLIVLIFALLMIGSDFQIVGKTAVIEI